MTVREGDALRRLRRRKRVQHPPPDFEREEAHAREYAAMICGLWAPELHDVKRLARGCSGLLFRGRRGDAVGLVVRGPHVLEVLTEAEFRAREEDLR